MARRPAERPTQREPRPLIMAFRLKGSSTTPGSCLRASRLRLGAHKCRLSLSRFVGAAEDLQEALLVNPYDVDETGHAMRRAIEVPRDERIKHHRALMKRVRKHSAGAAGGPVIALTDRAVRAVRLFFRE